MILLVLSVVIITPVMLFKYFKDTEQSLNLDYKLFSEQFLNEYFTSLSAMLVSLILIPLFIDLMSLMEDWRTKSAREVAVLNRNYSFMIINLLFLNLTGMTSIKAFLWEVEKQELQSWPQFLAQKMLSNYVFFVTYFI